MSENTGDSVKRRTVLKTAGSGLFVTSVAGSANAKQSARDLYDKSLKIKEQTGSVERWREFLRNHGFKLATDDAENKVAFDKPEGEASTERYYDTNISFSLTLSELCDDVYNVDLSWQYNPTC